MHSPYAKLKLSLADMPNDWEILVESLRQFTAAFINPPEAAIFPDLHLTVCELQELQKMICGRGSEPCDATSYVMIHRIRKKLKAARGMDIPTGERTQSVISLLTDETRQQIADLFTEGMGSRDDIHQLQRLLKFDPRRFDEGRLPKTIPELQQLMLDVWNLLRGDPEAIHFPGINAASEKIFMSTLLAQPDGCVTFERLFLALYPPFANDPPGIEIIPCYAFRVSHALANQEVTMRNHRSVGYSIDAANREKAYAVIEQPLYSLNDSASFLPPPVARTGLVDIHRIVREGIAPVAGLH